MSDEKLDDSLFAEEVVASIPEEPIIIDDEKIEVVPVVKVDEKPRGYQSYEEWKAAGKDPDEYKGKKAYEKEGERYEALIRTQREVKELKELTTKMWEANQKIEEASYNRAKEELKAQMMSATSIGDVDTVSKVSDKLLELEAVKPKPVVQPEPVRELPPVIQEFIYKHPYYKAPKTADDFAKKGFIEQQDHMISAEYKAMGIDLTLEQHMSLLNKKVEAEFGTKPVRAAVLPETASDVGHSPSEARTLINKLTPEHKKIVQMLQKQGGMTTAQLKDYVRRAGLIGGTK